MFWKDESKRSAINFNMTKYSVRETIADRKLRNRRTKSTVDAKRLLENCKYVYGKLFHTRGRKIVNCIKLYNKISCYFLKIY